MASRMAATCFKPGWSMGLFIRLLLILSAPFCQAYTYDQDVYAINNLFVALGSPPLPGWIPNGGDPCIEGWQGVQCVNSNITAITLTGANLGGELGDKLANFTSIITINLSNNHIGGNMPENLPVTVREFFLSANLLTGSIPTSLSSLSLLSAMSLNNNLLTGELPDAFQYLSSLTNLDLSSNNLTGQLPPSMSSLSSLTTLHIQNNQFTGTLNVLQDLPLKDLNIENNIFSGPVPINLLNIPNFKKDGNPFNTSIAPSSSPSPPPFSESQFPGGISGNASSGPSSQISQSSNPTKTKKSSSRIVLIAFAAVVALIFLVALVLLILKCCLSRLRRRTSDQEKVSRAEPGGTYGRLQMKHADHVDLPLPSNDNFALPSTDLLNDQLTKAPKAATEKPEDFEIDNMGVVLMPPPPVDKVIVKPINPQEEETTKVIPPVNPSPTRVSNPPTSVVSFSVAFLQQYTNSFSEDNLIHEGRHGKVYQADLLDGKKMMVMKLDKMNPTLPVDDFLDLVLSISELRHSNIVELVGYCAEYEQRLLVYDYFSKRNLHDLLHSGDDLRRRLSWNARVQIALGAARALEYLHEGCQMPIIHQNFESANVLVNNELAVRVCDCGLASMMSNSVSQLPGRIRSLISYEAPELSDSGTYSDRSDVYSFGVVMLELLTGREPYDGSRPRAEQHLVRWASSQLHDIDTLSKMVDPAIDGKYPVKSLSRFADIISRCVQPGPEFRPPISEVVQDLTLIIEEVKKIRDSETTAN